MMGPTSQGSMGGWSPASTSAAPRRRSSSPTIGTGSSTSTSSRRTGRRSSARSPVSSTAPGASCGRTSPRSASPSPATSIPRTERSAWPSTWASRIWRWDRCCRPCWRSVFVEHDARAAAVWLSEQAADGSAQAPASLAFLAIGTGISAGVVLNGALLRGDNGVAGEMGHVVADPDGAACACGLRGCLEIDRRRPGDRSPGRRGVGGRSQLHPDARSECRRRLPRHFCRRRGRGRDHRPSGRPPGPSHSLARPDPRRQASRHRRRRGGGRTGPPRSIRSRIARERAASPLVQAALDDASVELLSPSEAPGARGAAAIARHRIGLPEREGVGER